MSLCEIQINALRKRLNKTGRILILSGLACLQTWTGRAGDLPSPGTVVLTPDLRLKEYLKVVLAHNESIQAQMFATEAVRRKYNAELGIFEPNLVGNVNRVSNTRQNNNQDLVSQNGAAGYRERNNLFDGGIETLLPVGGKIRVGYSMNDLGNTLTPIPNSNIFGGGTQTSGVFSNQWQSFAGLTLSQPLLKNGGVNVTFGKIRLAALQSDIGFQEYRKQLMITVAQAEHAYWELYFTQEQLKSTQQDLEVSESVLGDSKAKVKAGKAAELDILEGEAGVAMSETRRNAAIQRNLDAISNIYTLCGAYPVQGGAQVTAIDEPDCAEVALSYGESCQALFELNPDYLSQKKKVDQEAVRLGVARNQMLPELNFKGAYGYNGLGSSPYETSPNGSWNAIRSENFPAWSAGLEVHIPLFGCIQGRNEFIAQKLTLKQAETNLQGLATQFTNKISNSIQKNRSRLGTIHDFETVIQFREELVKNTLAKLQAGKIEARAVLDESKDLFQARQGLAESRVAFQDSLLELQLTEGSVLKKRNLEITRKELRQQTIVMVKNHAPETGNKPSAVKKSQPSVKK